MGDVVWLEAVRHTLVSEGILSNNANDNGGLTKYGITKPFLSDYLGRPATSADIIALTVDSATAVYRKLVWDALRLSETPAEIAPAVFDFAVNSGKHEAVKVLQGVLGVPADGALGEGTLKALNAFPVAKLRKLRNDYVIARGRFLMRLVQSDPSQVEFLGGWFIRDVEELDFAY